MNIVDDGRLPAELRKMADDASLMRQMIENLPICLFTKDAKTGRYRLCNTKFAAYCCKSSPEEVIGLTDEEIFDAKTAAAFQRDDIRMLESGKLLEIVETVPDPSGRVYHFGTVKTSFVDKDGSRCLLGYSVDRTEELNNHLKVLQLNERLQMSLAIARLRADAMDRLTEDFDFDRILDFFGQRIIQIVHCDQVVYNDMKGGCRIWNENGLVANNDASCAGCPLRSPNATVYDDDLLVLPDVHQPVKGVTIKADCPVKSLLARRIYCHKQLAGLLTIHFISKQETFSAEVREAFELAADLLGLALERRQAVVEREARLRQIQHERDRAVAAEKAKSYFFSTVSHDIRTPLNAIIGFAQMLKIGIASEAERREAVDSIMTSSNVLLQLINDVLDLSKLESGKMEILPKPTDFLPLVQSVAEAFRPTAADKGIMVGTDVPPLPLLVVDPQRIRQILFNLIGNAIKFTERGGVFVSVRYTDGVLALCVKDTGCGIAEKDLLKLAQPFVQVGGDEHKRAVGTGLGLSIVRHLVARMGGKMDLSSEVGHGTEVRITIPAVQSDAEPEAGSSSARRLVPEPAANMDLRAVTGRILVVDDSPVNLIVLVRLLKMLGCTDVETAVNGRDALEKMQTGAAERPFSLVLTDMWMPEMDGEEFVQALRADPRFAHLAVVAVTADVEAKKNYAEIGFSGVLLKPVTLERLKAAIVAVMSGSAG